MVVSEAGPGLFGGKRSLWVSIGSLVRSSGRFGIYFASLRSEAADRLVVYWWDCMAVVGQYWGITASLAYSGRFGCDFARERKSPPKRPQYFHEARLRGI